MQQSSREWWKNVGASIKNLWKMVVNQYPGARLINGVFVSAAEVKKKGLQDKGVPIEKVKITLRNVFSIKNRLRHLVGEREYDNIKEIAQEVKNKLKTGKFIEKDEFLGDDYDEVDALIGNIESFDSKEFAEDYKGGYEMFRTNLETSLIRLKQASFAESLNLVSDMDSVNEAIGDMCRFVVAKCESIMTSEPGLAHDLYVEATMEEMKKRYFDVVEPLAAFPAVLDRYSESLSAAAIVITETHADYVMKEPNEENIDNLLHDVYTFENRIKDTHEPLCDKVRERTDDTKTEIELTRPDIALIKPNMKAYATSAESYIGLIGGGSALGSMAAGAAGVAAVMALFTVIPAMWAASKNSKFADKFGANSPVKQPMLASSNISSSTVKKLSKAIEIKTAIQIKALLESSIIAADQGMVNKRLADNKSADFLTKGKKIDYKPGLNRNEKLSYDQILSIFSESAKTDFLGVFSSDSLHLLEYGWRHFNRYKEDVNLIACRKPVGEARDINIDALPTTLQVVMHFKTENHTPGSGITLDKGGLQNRFSLTNSAGMATRETSITVDVTPKVVNGNELINSISANSFSDLVDDTASVTFLKRVKDCLTLWKRDSNPEVKKVLKSKGLADDIAKLSRVKTPLFHLMLEYSDYIALKKKGLDIMDEEGYTKLMKVLPILSITIVMEDSGMVYMSEGKTKMFMKKKIDEFVDSSLELEKDLRADLKFRHNL